MTNPEVWTAVDSYYCDALVEEDPALVEALRDSAAAGLPAIAVSPNQGKFLHLLAKMQRARRVLEFGTLGGYSTIWLGRALPKDGKLVSLEIDPHHASVARANIARAGLSEIVDVRVGRAIDTVALLAAEGLPPFDLVFIDADKPGNPDYLEASIRMSRPGTVIVVDNVARKGAVVQADSVDPNVLGVRRLFALLHNHPRLTATAMQTVGSKGHDGFVLALVTG